MITCLGDAFFPDVGVATVRLLRRLGVEVDFPPAQTCCGQPHFNSGYHDDARDLARHTIAAFADAPLGRRRRPAPAPRWSSWNIPSCSTTTRPGTRRAEDLAGRTHELSDFLVNVLGVEDVGARFEGRATYHMACHLRGLGLLTEPERLLRRVQGLDTCRWSGPTSAAASAAPSRCAIPASAARWSATRRRSSRSGRRCRGGDRRRLPDEHRRLPAPPRQPGADVHLAEVLAKT